MPVCASRPDLMVKKLRYYARFIVVCLLLKKMKLVRDLVRVRDLHNLYKLFFRDAYMYTLQAAAHKHKVRAVS